MESKKRLIDANTLLNLLKPLEEQSKIFKKILLIIRNCPTVEAVEVVHGRWMKTCLPDIYQCTNCKRATKMDELCDSEILRAYCPNCGAKMIENGAKNGK